MRVSTLGFFNRGLNGMLNASAATSEQQARISSGRRFLTPADDPVAATRILELNQSLTAISRYKGNITAAENRLTLEEGVLKSVNNNIVRIRELTVQAGNGSLLREDRRFIATELQQRLGDMMGLMNSVDAQGEYLFSGSKGNTEPFVRLPGGGFAYRGDEDSRAVQITASKRLQTSDNGAQVFMNMPAAAPTAVTRANPHNQGAGVISAAVVLDQEAFAGLYPDDVIIEFNPATAVQPAASNFTVRNATDGRVINGQENVTYFANTTIAFAGTEVRLHGEPASGDRFRVQTTGSQDLLTTADRLIQGLNSISDQPGQQGALDLLIEQSLANLDTAQENILQARARIGGRLNTLDSTLDLHLDTELTTTGVLSDLRDIDYAEAVSQLSLQSFVLEAAQQSFARISNISLISLL